MANKVRVAIVGLGFGAEFIPIYQEHPDAEMYAICQRNAQNLQHVGEQFGVAKRYTNYDELIKDPNVDAVHINSPIPDHAWMSVKALQAGSMWRARCRWGRAWRSAGRSSMHSARAARRT
jgi:predicted dehydrogenase